MNQKKKGQWALDFGRLLRDRRRELGLSQQQVADGAGIHRTLLADYERDGAPERVPTDITLHGLARALDVPDELMFEWADVSYPVAVDVSVGRSAPPDLVKTVLQLRDELLDGLADLSDRLERLERAAEPPRPRGRRPSTGAAQGRQGRS